MVDLPASTCPMKTTFMCSLQEYSFIAAIRHIAMSDPRVDQLCRPQPWILLRKLLVYLLQLCFSLGTRSFILCLILFIIWRSWRGSLFVR